MTTGEEQDAARATVRRWMWKQRPRRGAQKQLAEMANVGYTTISHWLGGRHRLGMESLAQIAAALDLEVEQLFYNPPDEAEPEPHNDSKAEEDWRETVREVERYVRSIQDPERRLAVALRIRAVALGEVKDYERDAEREVERRLGIDGHSAGAGAKPRAVGKRS